MAGGCGVSGSSDFPTMSSVFHGIHYLLSLLVESSPVEDMQFHLFHGVAFQERYRVHPYLRREIFRSINLLNRARLLLPS